MAFSSTSKNSERTDNKTSAEKVLENDDIMVEIIIRLPVRTIITSKLVSKHMRFLITSAWFLGKFIALRKKRQQADLISGILVYKSFYSKEGKLLSLNDIDDVKKIQIKFPIGEVYILHSCNGLFICCSNYERGMIPGESLFVCNPTTGKSVEIPHPGYGWEDHRYLAGIGLAFDPRRSLEYKVVAIRISNDAYSAEVYSSAAANRSWRHAKGEKLEFRCGVPCMFRDNAVYFNGAIYWLEGYFLFGAANVKIEFVFSFNISDESIRPLKFPPLRAGSAEEKNLRFNYLGSSCDHLQLIESLRVPDMPNQYVLYEMNIDSSPEWLVKYTFNFNDIPQVLPTGFLVLSIVQGEEKNDRALVIALHGMVIHYELKNKTSRCIWNYYTEGRYDSNQFNWRHAFQYSETLFPV